MPAMQIKEQWEELLVSPKWAGLSDDEKLALRKRHMGRLEADSEYREWSRQNTKLAAESKVKFLNREAAQHAILRPLQVRKAEEAQREAETARLMRFRGRLGGVGYTPAGAPEGFGPQPPNPVDTTLTVGANILKALDVPLVAVNAFIIQRPEEAVETIKTHLKARSVAEQEEIIQDLLGTTDRSLGRQMWRRIVLDPTILPGLVVVPAKLATAAGRALLRKLAKRAAKELPVEDVPQTAKTVAPTKAPAMSAEEAEKIVQEMRLRDEGIVPRGTAPKKPPVPQVDVPQLGVSPEAQARRQAITDDIMETIDQRGLKPGTPVFVRHKKGEWIIEDVGLVGSEIEPKITVKSAKTGKVLKQRFAEADLHPSAPGYHPPPSPAKPPFEGAFKYVPAEELPEGVSQGPIGAAVAQSNKVEEAIAAGRMAEADVPGRAQNVWRRLLGAREEAFVEEPLLKPFKGAYAAVKEFKLFRQNIPVKVSDILEGPKGVFGGSSPLTKGGGLTIEEVNQVGDFVLLKDWAATAARGQKLPFDVTGSEVAAALKTRGKEIAANPKLQERVKLLKQRLDELGQRFVDEGLLEQSRKSDWYYHHDVIPYLEDAWREMGGRRLQAPSFGALKPRKGSTYPIRTDHVENLRKYFTAAEHVLSKSKTIRGVMEAESVAPQAIGLTEKEFDKLALFTSFEAGGKRYMKYRFGYPFDDEANALFNALDGVLEQGGQKPLFIPRSAQAGKGVILPEAVATRLLSFSEPKSNEAIRSLNALTNAWKTMTLAAGHVPFLTANLVGNILGVPFFSRLKDVPKFYAKDLWKGIHTAAKGTLMESSEIATMGKSLTDVTRRQGLALTGLLGEIAPQKALKPRGRKFFFREGQFLTPAGEVLKKRLAKNPFSKLLTPEEKAWAKHLGRIPLDVWADGMQVSELPPKIAMLSRAIKNLEAGVPLEKVAQEVKLRGEWKTFEGAAGEITRVKMVDTTSLTKVEREYLTGLAMPFYGFFSRNLGRFRRRLLWGAKPKNVAEAATTGIIGLSVPYVFTHMWNNSTEEMREIEENLPDYMRAIPHIITPFEDEAGDRIIIRNTQDIYNAALEMFGIEDVPFRVVDIMKGKVKVREAAREQFFETMRDAAQFWVNLTNPLAKLPVEFSINKKLFSRGSVVPPEIPWASGEGLRRNMRHVAESLFRPLGERRRLEENYFEYRKGLLSFLAKPIVQSTDTRRNKMFKIREFVRKTVEAAKIQAIENAHENPQWDTMGTKERDILLRLMLQTLGRKLQRAIPSEAQPSFREIMGMELGKIRAAEVSELDFVRPAEPVYLEANP